MGLQHIDEVQRDSMLSSPPHGSTAFPPGTWILDPNTTRLTISTRVFRVHPLEITLRLRDGVVEVNERGGMERLHLSFVAKSLTSGRAFRDRHLRGPKFFDAETFPLVDFHGSATGPNIDCVMILKGRSGPLSCTATEASLLDDGRVVLSNHGYINRRAIGLDTASWWGIGRHLNIALSATASRA